MSQDVAVFGLPGEKLVDMPVSSEMAAFDLLPPLARRMLNDAPVKISAWRSAEYLVDHGEMGLVRFLRTKGLA